MSDQACRAFNGIALRPDLTAVLPRPLAHTYARLIAEVEANQPVAAVWALRDAWECAVRFAACVGVADLIQAGGSGPDFASVMGVLFKRTGLSFGDWAFLLAKGCDLDLPVTGTRLLPDLAGLYYDEYGLLGPIGLTVSRETAAGADGIDPGMVNVVTWRNRIIGHGVFRADPAWYERQAVLWLEPLHDFYQALLPVLDGWTLRDGGPDGAALTGAGQGMACGDHQHVGAGAPDRVVLAGPAGLLSFGPLLSAQRCLICAERHVFFYDRSSRRKDGPGALRTDLLDYVRGHQATRKGWAPALDWEALLPATHEWMRGIYDQTQVSEEIAALFRGFAEEYRRPDWILDQLWQAIKATPTGYVHLQGPSGTGKSYIARGLRQIEGPARGLPVLLYHIQAGQRGDYRTFISLLAAEAREQMRFATQEIQAKDQGEDGLRQQFVEFLTRLKQENGNAKRLLVVLDGLDELPARGPGEFSIVDFLGPASDLPAGCTVVLTSRPALAAGVDQRLAMVRAASGPAFQSLSLDPDDPGNRALLAAHALERLPEPMRGDQLAARIVDRAQGRFLFVFHLVQALRSGAFAPSDDLPPPATFYPVYLGRLRDRVGAGMFDGVFLPLLLTLAAARAPLTLDQLKSWGLRADMLAPALTEYADFIEEVRSRPWHERVDEADSRPRYRLAHQDFIRYVDGDPALAAALTATHAGIARTILNRHDHAWDRLGATDEEDVYDARAIFDHVRLGGVVGDLSDIARELAGFGAQLHALRRLAAAEAVLTPCVAVLDAAIAAGRRDLDAVLALALSNQGTVLQHLGRLEAAAVCLEQSVAIRRRLVAAGAGDVQVDLAMGLNNLGTVLQDLGRLTEAETCQAENVAILRRLEAAGKSDVRNALGAALSNHGSVLHALGELATGEACLREAVAIRWQLVTDGQAEVAQSLAATLGNHGNVLLALGDLEAAETCQRQNVAILRQWVGLGRIESEADLARGLHNLGGVLHARGELAAETFLRESCDLWRRLVQGGREELAGPLAQALAFLGRILQDQGQVTAAEACQREGAAILRRLVAAGRADLGAELARSLGHHGRALAGLGRLEEAESCHGEAVSLWRGMARDGREDLVASLATGLGHWGTVLLGLDRPEAAEACQRERVAILRRLAGAGQVGRKSDLAWALGQQGLALQAGGRAADAASCQRESVAILRDLVADGRDDLRQDLATALNNHGTVLSDLGEHGLAEACQRENVAIRRDLVAAGQDGQAEGLANALLNHAATLEAVGEAAAARAALDDSAAILRRLVAEGRDDLRHLLCAGLVGSGQMAFAVGDLDVAERCLDEAVAVSADDPHADAIGWRRNAWSDLADLHLARGEWQAVLAAADDMAAITGADETVWWVKLAQIRARAHRERGETAAALAQARQGLALAEQGLAAGDQALAVWRDAGLYHLAAALTAADDPQADQAIATAIDRWQARNQDGDALAGRFLGYGLTVRARRHLGGGDVAAALADGVAARALLEGAAARHWRDRRPLADCLVLLAEVTRQVAAKPSPDFDAQGGRA